MIVGKHEKYLEFLKYTRTTKRKCSIKRSLKSEKWMVIKSTKRRQRQLCISYVNQLSYLWQNSLIFRPRLDGGNQKLSLQVWFSKVFAILAAIVKSKWRIILDDDVGQFLSDHESLTFLLCENLSVKPIFIKDWQNYWDEKDLVIK